MFALGFRAPKVQAFLQNVNSENKINSACNSARACGKFWAMQQFGCGVEARQMKFEILNRWNQTVIFGIDLPDAIAAMAYKTRLGWAVLQAIKTRANLTDANLTCANLTRADLTDANLTCANLTRADLTDADLTRARADFFLILLYAKKEAPALLSALTEGRVNGSIYTGRCSCLIGTIATARGIDPYQIEGELYPKSSRPAERLFLAIREGDTPENNPVSAIAASWTREFLILSAS